MGTSSTIWPAPPPAVIEAAKRVKSSTYIRADVVAGETIGYWHDEAAFEADVQRLADFILKAAGVAAPTSWESGGGDSLTPPRD